MGVAHTMVWKLGMGPSSLVGDFTVVPEGQLSREVVTQLSQDTQKILSDCLKEVFGRLRGKDLAEISSEIHIARHNAQVPVAVIRG